MTTEQKAGTPAASWRQNGEADPHDSRYDCERAALAMGHLTDDELANGAFLNYDQPLNIAGILARTHASPIAWMTAVKDRIRWLSRKLLAEEQRANEAERRLAQLSPEQFNNARAALAEALGSAYDCTRVWSGWGHGTMGPDDFALVAGDDERLREITRAALLGAGLTVPD